MKKPSVYIDSCCFIEMACHLVKTHKQEREDDIPFLKQILQGAFEGTIEAYTSTLSIAECQCAYNAKHDARLLTDEIKKLFKDILTSGQFIVLIQDSVLVGERARNLYWVHDLGFSGADAVHIASAMEMKCDEFLTFDGRGPIKRKEELETLALTAMRPRETKSLTKEDLSSAEKDIVKKDQPKLPLGESAPIEQTNDPKN